MLMILIAFWVGASVGMLAMGCFLAQDDNYQETQGGVLQESLR